MDTRDPPSPDATAPGRLARATAWSKARAARASEWALGARDTHASVDVGFRVADRDKRVAAAVLAGGVAYRFFFWLLALALLGGGALGFADADGAEDAAADQGAGRALASAIGNAAQSSHAARWWLLVVGAWLLLWTGYMGAKTLVLVCSTVWGLPPRRLGNPLRASLVFTGATVGYLAAMTGARWVRAESEAVGFLATLSLILVPFCFWLAASWWLPRGTERLLDLVPGAVLVAVGVQALNLLTAYLLGPRLNNATELYGGLGIATTILFWLYIVARLVIGAAILDEALVERRRGAAAGP
jgi:uncharacterized BrkB/YihY/UPF0761 family membrane protein